MDAPSLPADSATAHVAVYQDVLQELSNTARQLDGAFGAVLTGAVDLSGAHVRWDVTGFEGLTVIEDWDVFLEHVLTTCDELWGQRGVGSKPAGLCFHQPGSQGHLQPPMAFVHLSLFNMPRQPLLVLDTQADALGAYTRPPNMKGQHESPDEPFENVPLSVVSA